MRAFSPFRLPPISTPASKQSSAVEKQFSCSSGALAWYITVVLTLCANAWSADSVEVRAVDGAPTLVVDGQPIPAHMFFNATSDRKLIADSLAKSFADAGIHLHQFDVKIDWREDFDKLDPATEATRHAGIGTRLRALAKLDPEALVLLRVQLSAPQTWAEDHPDEILTYQDGTRIFHSKWNSCHSYASKMWRKEAGERLAALIEHLQRSGLEKHVLGYMLFAGWSGEWNFYKQNRGDLSDKRYTALSNMTIDHSPAMRTAFREFLHRKYNTDDLLRKAWHSDSATLASAEPPTEEQVLALLPKQLNDPTTCANVSDYFECNSQQVTDSLLHFSRVAKKTSPRRIAGAFFGEFMYAHIGGTRARQRAGHADFDRVMASRDIDFICSPQSYQSRSLGGHSPSMCLVGSARLHGKLVWYEFDQPTHLALHPPEKTIVPNSDVPQNLAETRALMRRGFGYVLANRIGLWWWDQAGRWGKAVEGGVWYKSDEVRAEFALYQRIWKRALQAPQVLPRPEIAVIYDPRQCFFQQSSWRDLSYDLIHRQLDALGKMGAPYDIYSLADVDAGELDGYKLYIMWNAFHLTDPQATTLKRLTRREGVTTLWFYAPGYLSPGGLVPARVSDLTGMGVTQVENLSSFEMEPTQALDPGGDHSLPFGRSKPILPAWQGSDGKVLATYKDTTIPAAAMIARDGWRSFYFASAPLPAWVLHRVAALAGCHQYVDGDDVVYVAQSHIVIHTAKPGRHVLRLPGELKVKDSATGQILSERTRRIELTCDGPTTWLLEVSR